MDHYSIIVEHVSLTYRAIMSISLKHEMTYSGMRNFERVREFQALKNVSLNVEPGKAFGIIGANGAGKSTLLKLIAGVFQPDSGSVRLASESVSLLSLGAGFELELSGIENIYINGVLLGFGRKQISGRIPAIMDFADIGDFIYKPLRTYSSGMRSRLAFAIASCLEPEILLIDEMLGVGDEEFRQKSYERICELIRSGRTILLASHNVATIRRVCDEVVWMDRGQIVERGETERVVEAYLEFVRAKQAAKLALHD